MQTVWRIVTRHFAEDAYSGEGSRRFGGRWNRIGQSLVYTAQSRSLALLEMLVQDSALLAHYLLIPASIPTDISRQTITLAELKKFKVDWRSLEAREVLQNIGSHWLNEGSSCMLEVPSAVMPAESNFLLNPAHPDFARINIGKHEPLESDLRLLRKVAASR
jgi:RES domain-containing protein